MKKTQLHVTLEARIPAGKNSPKILKQKYLIPSDFTGSKNLAAAYPKYLINCSSASVNTSKAEVLSVF